MVMPLGVASGSSLPIPVQTITHIEESKIETPNDLRFFFASESEVATFLSKEGGIPDLELMTARLRAAWHATRQQASMWETDKPKVDITDLDGQVEGGHNSRAIAKLQGSKDAAIAGHKCSLTMKDSTRLCRAFQAGQCRSKGTECPNGKHQCAVLVRDTGRVCGLKNHGAAQHRQ
jgi:hypothetical protein